MIETLPSSFRDPNGFVFRKNGNIYRQVNISGKDDYDHLINSGLYRALVERGWLIKHTEVKDVCFNSEHNYRTLKPDEIFFISYPYEWSFSQLKDAAILTLNIQNLSLTYGMCLRDASAYNIQFHGGKPVLIDTLSLGIYEEGKPWQAYRQFCQHFLAPLLLMSKVNVNFSVMFKVFIDGFPLEFTSSILPIRTWLNPRILLNIHLHALSQSFLSRSSSYGKSSKLIPKINKNILLGIIEGLNKFISLLKWSPKNTEWFEYYKNTNYSDDSMKHKHEVVRKFIAEINPKSVWDMGANNGFFSRIASDQGIKTISLDIDPAAVEINYLKIIEKGETDILPLVMNFMNPSPSIGWDNNERMSLSNRGPCDCIFALAIIHHLAIANNIPLVKISEYFSRLCKNLIIEFIPKNDSQINNMLATRADIFGEYSITSFELEFSKHFTIKRKVDVAGSNRVLYWMSKNEIN